jgi:membrane-associated phospholipid phosphatase
MVGFMLILTFNSDGSSPQYFALSLILAGIICSARLLAGAHKPGDVYVGLFIGVLSQVAALVL